MCRSTAYFMRLRGVIFLPTIGFAFDMGMMGKILTEMPPLILEWEVASISSISIVECDLIVYSLQLRGKGGEGAKDAPSTLRNSHQKTPSANKYSKRSETKR